MFHYICFKSKKVIILGDFLLNGINEKSLSKKHNVKIVNKPGGTSERLLLEDLDNLIKYQPEGVIIHASTNNLTNGIIMLNNAKKIAKERVLLNRALTSTQLHPIPPSSIRLHPMLIVNPDLDF